MRSTRSSLHTEQLKQLGCQARWGPAREAVTQMSLASITPVHWNEKKMLNDWILELFIVIWRKKSRSHFWNGDFLEIPPLFHEFFKRLDKKKTVTQMSLASITPVHCKQKSKVGWWVIFFFLFLPTYDVGTWCIW